jgi:hypothetical protein
MPGNVGAGFMPALTNIDEDRSGGDKPRPYRIKEEPKDFTFLEVRTWRRKGP